MKLYNTLTRQVDEIAPLKAGEISIYSCGPTVYDHIHIGNLASFIFADTLRRTLSAAGLKAHHVMNFTDVDDKTIRRSQEEYADIEPKEALLKLTAEYSAIFMEDMKAVGNDVQAVDFIKATDSIAEMQQLILELLSAKIAYHSDDGIYFSINAYKEAGKTYGQLTEVTVNSTSQARIQNDEYDKESAHDFALWKKQKGNEPAWDFEADGQNVRGRPGWHIECSAMSRKLLGQPFDIHTGGVDLVFPHHENEIAQTTGTAEDPLLAKAFVHNEHLLVDGKKMSKSLNNFYTLNDIAAKNYQPLAFRLLVLQANYKNQAHFTWENLEAAQNRLKDYRAMAALRWQPVASNNDAPSFAMEEVPGRVLQCLENNLDTPNALSLLSNVSTQLQAVLIDVELLEHFLTLLKGVDDLLGLQLMAVPDISDDQKQLLEARERSRGAKDWAKADEMRDKLKEQSIGLRDTDHGAIWFWL